MLGVEPLALLRSQMELVHRITVTQVGRGGAEAISAEERAAIQAWAQQLSPAQLHRLWQLLLKGHDEVRLAPDPLIAGQMALLRVLHAAELPDPGQLVRKLEQLAANPGVASGTVAVGGGATGSAGPAAVMPDWAGLVEQVEHAAPLVGAALRLAVRVVELRPGLLRYSPVPGLSPPPEADIRKVLDQVTGQSWQVEPGEGEAAPSLEEAREAEAREAQARLRRDPLVEAAFAAFPDAQIVEDESSPAGSGGANRNWSRTA